MSRCCTECGAAQRTDLVFCTSCGHPQEAREDPCQPVDDRLRDPDPHEVSTLSPRRRPTWPALTTVSLLLVAAVVITVLVVGGGSAPAPPPPVTAPASGATGPAVVSPVPVAQPEESAATLLSDTVSQDAASMSSLDGSWVPQISSKSVGLRADGIVYDEAAILGDYRTSAARYPQAVLLRSDQFATFSSPGFYVTVIGVPYSTAAQANAWCDSEGLPSDACFAKRLSSTSVSGATVAHR